MPQHPNAERELTWEQKFDAIKALEHDAHLRMRGPGDWFVGGTHAEIKREGTLVGLYGNGTTPQEAVEDHWRKWTKLDTVLIKDARSPERSAWKWNGWRWMGLSKEHAE